MFFLAPLVLRAAAGVAARGAATAVARGSAGAAVRGGGGALVRGTAARGVGGAAVRGLATSVVRSAAFGLIGNKNKDKKITTKKFIPQNKKGGGKGGALVLRRSSAIVKSSSGALVKTEDKKPGRALVKSTNIRDEILQELERIKIDVVKIKEISTQKLLNQKEESRLNFIEGRKKKAEEQEKSLEEKKDTKKKKKLGITAPKVGLFDMISRFLLNVLMGSLISILLKNGPMILQMFKDIGKGLTNTWNVLKLGIITLTTVFPKQVKFIAKLTSKIIGPPAKLIGKLLLKAGRIAGNLFKKAGGVIFNIIKGPLKSLVQRVGGEALEQGVKGAAKGAAKFAGKAVSAASNALKSPAVARIVKRLKSFSKIFKRVPVVGALIGIGIDLALGEKLDRAVVGAIGASLGAGIGGAIGQGLIPIPVVGAAVGGFVGAGIGEWAGKKIYENLTGRVAEADKENPIERKAFGGSINVRGGSSRTLSKSSSIQRKTTTTAALSQQTLNKAKNTVLKDEQSAKRFANLSSAYGAIPFVGEAMKLGLDISLGERVSKSRTDAIAESIGSTIGMALKNEEFSVPGFNKRIIGEFSKNLTTWAKRKIFISVKSQENQFKSLQEKKREAEKSGGDGGDGGGDGTSTPSSGASEGQWGPLLDLIAGKESGGNYEAMYPSTTLKGATKMTIAEVARRATGAVGKYQQLPQYLISRAKAAGLNPDKDLFSPKNQDLIITKVNIEGNRGGRRWLKGEMSDERFMQGLSQEFASLPNAQGKFYYPGQRSSMTPEKIRSALAKVKGGGNISVDIASKPVKNGGKGGGNGIKFHQIPFLAMGGNHIVTSSMGLRNFALSPGMHMGVDIAGKRGEPLQAFTDGVVEATGYDGGYGNWVNWIDNKGIGHFYAHMDKKASVKAGQKINKGTILGPLGNTGKSSGPHLHWEAATNPRDNGMPKSNVLSRFNPLSRYNKESPFGGSIQPDPSSASSDIASSSSDSQDSSKPKFEKSFITVLGDPAAGKGGRGGGNGIDLWGISPSRNAKLGKNSGFTDVPSHHRSYTTEAGLPRDYAVVKSGVNPVANPSAGRGENVVAGVSGKVTYAGFASGAGNHVVVSSGGKEIIRLLHLDKILARTGQSVNPSTVIGTQGNSGTKDIHVHVDGSQAVHTNWIKAMLGGQYESNPSAGSGESGGTSQPGAPEEKKPKLEFIEVIGDPSVNKSITEDISQTPSYNKSGQSLILMQGSGGGSVAPVRSKSRSGASGGMIGSDSMVNSYGMVSRQIISSSLYKL
jgi:murein DD-endopeptidase MepM/ murein hydrolase activator NlpD